MTETSNNILDTRMPPPDPQIPFSSSHIILIDDKFVSDSSTVFTVWKKSLLLNGTGFTVLDSSGALVFRVDNYACNVKDEVVLMDSAGNVLITMLRKRWSAHNRWEAFRGDPLENEKPIFSLTKPSRFSNKTTTNVFVNGSGEAKTCDYHMEGSLCKPSCKISSASGDIIAEVSRKGANPKATQEANPNITLGNDVFSLVIQPGTDQAFVMGLLIIFNEN